VRVASDEWRVEIQKPPRFWDAKHGAPGYAKTLIKVMRVRIARVF
jgi:hypothetical protein